MSVGMEAMEINVKGNHEEVEGNQDGVAADFLA
jgi:hypothetical protein